MNWFKRFIWWKCAFWFALGAALGGALSIVFPDSGPGSAQRIPVEQFVSIFQYPVLTDGEHISDIVVFPAHDGVELLMFNLNGKQSVSAYVYAQRPFTTVNRMKTYEQQVALKRAMAGRSLGPRFALAALQMQERQAHMDAFHDWDSAADFLQTIQAAHPNLQVRRAWWADRNLQRWIAVVTGFVTIGALCSLLLARRTKEQQAAYELMSTAGHAPPLPSAPAAPSEEDLRRVRELDEALAKNLAAGIQASDDSAKEAAEVAAPAGATIGQPQPALRKFTDEPLAAPVEAAKEEKDYAGDFYPTERRIKPQADRSGFSLVELIVAIGIITVIMGLLLPALIGARRSADTITCAANLHSIGQGLIMYTQANQNTYPAAYGYVGQQIVNGVQTPPYATAGYIHWSSYLYGSGSVPQSAFTCPSMDRGGLPPTNTTPENTNVGQICPLAAQGIVDQQVPRLAYTVNEALCPRNKFVTNFQSATRVYRYVKADEVSDPSNTILATEMVDNGNMVSYGEQAGWIGSHRPINGFCNSSTPDVFQLPIAAGFRPCTASDIDPDPLSETSSNSRLDLAGRNHGPRQSYPDHRLSNFAYCDGHVETKSIYDTVGPSQPFQWGAQFYSLVPNDDEQP